MARAGGVMDAGAWLSLVIICTLGAVSPGPSLAVVVRHTLVGGRREGVITALAHAAGIGVYALAVAMGLAVIIAESPSVFRGIQLGGAAFLVYIGIRALTRSGGLAEDHGLDGRPLHGARDGFLIAFLNPKIAIFFLALFSQLVGGQARVAEKLGMAAVAAGIDALWYLLVAMGLSHGSVLPWLRRRGVWLDRFFGIVLLALGVRVVLL